MKVICDVCGTSFPETATHCPICGCAKTPAAQPVAGDDAPSAHESSANTYAKGGRFSKSNVKRNSHSSGRFSNDRNRRNEPQQGNKGLIAVVIILLLAIVMVVVYIGVKVLFNDFGGTADQGGNNQTTGAYQEPSGSQGGQGIACTSVKLNSSLIVFTASNEQFLLSVEKEPANTTDTLTFTSSDPAVATVNENGLVLPVGYGEAVITVTCGTVKAECPVNCTIGEPPASEPSQPQVGDAPDGFVLKLETYKDSGEITISGEGGTHKLYKEIMGVKASDITWTTSDPAVATVEDGKVTGVDRGTCTITAAIGDQVVTCFVRCSFDAAPPSQYALSHTSVTIAKGESFNLSLKDKDTGANVQGIEWQANKSGVVEINGNKITGGSVNDLTVVDVFVEYEDIKYICKVYVKAPNE